MKQLVRALQAFIREQGLQPNVFPSASMLRAADRLDLLNSINEHGGLFALQPKIGMATTRGPGWPDITTAAQQLQKVAKTLQGDLSAELGGQMPTMAQLRDAGRKDLVYAVQKFGYAEIADAAGLLPRHTGRGRSARLLADIAA